MKGTLERRRLFLSRTKRLSVEHPEMLKMIGIHFCTGCNIKTEHYRRHCTQQGEIEACGMCSQLLHRDQASSG